MGVSRRTQDLAMENRRLAVVRSVRRQLLPDCRDQADEAPLEGNRQVRLGRSDSSAQAWAVYRHLWNL